MKFWMLLAIWVSAKLESPASVKLLITRLAFPLFINVMVCVPFALPTPSSATSAKATRLSFPGLTESVAKRSGVGGVMVTGVLSRSYPFPTFLLFPSSDSDTSPR